MSYTQRNFLVFIALFCLILLFSVNRALAQWTAEQEAKSNAEIEQLKENAKNLPPHEKKIATFILTRINKMIAENAKDSPNIQEKYGTWGFPVDAAGRVQVNVALLLTTPRADSVLVTSKIRKLGGTVRLVSSPLGNYPVEIYCWLPYDIIKEIAKLSQVGNISSIGLWTTYTGSVTTIGDTQLHATQARSYFNCAGSGIKVGVISDGIQHAGESQSSGDLPYLQSIYGDKPGDEGTAMLEIVYDIAPAASLFFGGMGGGTYGPNDMVQRVGYLYNSSNCNIIVADLGWYQVIPLFSEDAVMQKIQYELGINNRRVYVSAAGNDFYNYYHCEEPFFDGNNKHIFSSTNDIYNSFILQNNQPVHLILQWANQWGNAPENYDLFLLNNALSVVASGTVVQNGSGFNPEELIEYTNSSGSTQTYNVRIDRVNASEVKPLKLIAKCPASTFPDIDLEYTYCSIEATAPYGQISGHRAADGAISVVAYNSDNPNEIADYSSRDPT